LFEFDLTAEIGIHTEKECCDVSAPKYIKICWCHKMLYFVDDISPCIFGNTNTKKKIIGKGNGL